MLTVPAGYGANNRRAVNISFNGPAYSEARLLAFGHAYEQATGLRRPASEIVPSLYRCARTKPRSIYASRGGCAPGIELLAQIGAEPELPFAIETESAQSLAQRMSAGTLTSVALGSCSWCSSLPRCVASALCCAHGRASPPPVAIRLQ